MKLNLKTILLPLLFVYFFLFVTQILFAQGATSDCVVTRIGDPEGNPSPPAGCEESDSPNPSRAPSGTPPENRPPETCGTAPDVDFTSAEEYSNAIAKKWGIMMNLPLEQMQYAWEAFHEIDCTGILQDIQGSVIQSWGEAWSQQFSCPGDAAVDLYIGTHFGGDWVKALLVHEITHIWQLCTEPGEANLLQIPDAAAVEGYISIYSRGECALFQPPNPNNEDHADTIALYLNPDIGELTCGNGAPNPFTGGKYPMHRAIAEEGTKN